MEEAKRVGQIVAELLVPGARWIHRDGDDPPLTRKDALVVSSPPLATMLARL